MYNGVESPHHQSGIQPDERFPYHVDTPSASCPSEARTQAEVVTDLSLQPGILHRRLRHPQQALEFHESLQRQVGLLVLSRIEHRHDRHKYAIFVGSDKTNLQFEILL